MNFLPYGRRDGSVWYTSVVASGLAHIGVAAFVLAGAMPFLPKAREQVDPLADVFVSLEIVTVEAVPEMEPLLDEDLLEPIEEVLEEDDLDDFDSLEADEPEAELSEIVDDSLQPVEVDELAEAPVVDAEVIPEQEPVAKIAELAADVPDVRVVAAEPENAETAIEQEPTEALDIASASLVADAEEIISPLAELDGGGGFAPLTSDEGGDVVGTIINEIPSGLVLQADEGAVAELLSDPLFADIEIAALPLDLSVAQPVDDIVQNEGEGDQVGEIVEEQPQSTKGPVIAQPSAQARTVAQVIRGIRNGRSLACTMALPRRTAGGGVGLSLIGEEDQVLETVAQDILSNVDASVTQFVEIIDSRQCAALDALRQVEAYPATRVGIMIEDINLTSGDNLKARIIGAGGLFMTLLLVDDNGVVQNLDRFTEIDGTEMRIDAPVARSGVGRDTRQVLLALGHAESAIELGEFSGETAQYTFTKMPLEKLKTIQFGLATFDVK
jgi:hypothetical protein